MSSDDIRESCGICDGRLTDGAHCYACNIDMHYACGGVKEETYRKLGAKKQQWRCNKCKQEGRPILQNIDPSEGYTSLLEEIRKLSDKICPLESMREDLKAIREEFHGMKSMLASVNTTLQEYSDRIKKVEVTVQESCDKIKDTDGRLTRLEETKNDQVVSLKSQLDKLLAVDDEREQFVRTNNVEIKGVPQSKNENLFELVFNLGKRINYPLTKSQINFVTRVQSRNPDHMKPIIVAFHCRYTKDDFIAAARMATKTSPLMSVHLGIEGKPLKIFVNDHLTVKNKELLTSTKKAAKERGFQYVWVKNCKIFVRKNEESPIILIRSAKDLSKLI